MSNNLAIVATLSEKLAENECLKIVDLGHNQLDNWDFLSVLQKLPLLENLTLKVCCFNLSLTVLTDALFIGQPNS